MAGLLNSTGGIGTYNVNPAPTSGNGAYGQVPGQIGLPPSNYQQALGQVPGLAQNAATATGDVQNLLQGNLSQGTQDYISRLVAAKGVNAGMPGSQFNTADLVTSLGLTSEQLVNSGLSSYNALLSTIGGLQENPGLMADVAQTNATLGAAPNPEMAANQLIQDMLNQSGADPAGYGSTTILGPKPPGPTYTGAFNSPIGSPDWAGLGNPDYAVVGGALPTPGQPTASLSPWAQYQQSSLGGYQLGNRLPQGASGTGTEDPNYDWAGINELYGDASNDPAYAGLIGG